MSNSDPPVVHRPRSVFPTPLMIQLQDVTYRVGSKALLDGVTLALRPGEVLAVVGANGAGKTTLLRLLSGERAPSDGTAHLDGQPLGSFDPKTLARRRAVLPQQSTLGFGFSVLEVVLLGRTPHRTAHARDLDIVGHAMRAAGVSHLGSRRYPTLSGGEQQRVHFARALAQIWEAPEQAGRYLLLDEPTASLDLAHQHSVLRTARRCAAAGVGVLAVLHDLNLAAQHADRIAVLCRGRLVAEGAPEAVLTSEIILRAFDISVLVTEHPCATCPLVVPVPEDRMAERVPARPDLLVRNGHVPDYLSSPATTSGS